MEVRRLTPDDAEELRIVRLEGLRLHPTAFSADPDIESALSLEEWRARLESRVWFGGRIDRVLMGINAFSIDAYSKKVIHIGQLGAMYVREPARGTGLASALIEALLAHAANEVEQVVLTVEATNIRAIRLYEKHGFETIGRMPRGIRVGDAYYDELTMLRTLRSA